jgi:hypothetical protein
LSGLGVAWESRRGRDGFNAKGGSRIALRRHAQERTISIIDAHGFVDSNVRFSWPLILSRVRVSVALRRVLSGCVNDYVEWLVAGLAIIGAALAFS